MKEEIQDAIEEELEYFRSSSQFGRAAAHALEVSDALTAERHTCSELFSALAELVAACRTHQFDYTAAYEDAHDVLDAHSSRAVLAPVEETKP